MNNKIIFYLKSLDIFNANLIFLILNDDMF